MYVVCPNPPHADPPLEPDPRMQNYWSCDLWCMLGSMSKGTSRVGCVVRLPEPKAPTSGKPCRHYGTLRITLKLKWLKVGMQLMAVTGDLVSSPSPWINHWDRLVYFAGTLGLTKDHILQLWVTEEYNTSDLFKKYLQIAQQRGVSHFLHSCRCGWPLHEVPADSSAERGKSLPPFLQMWVTSLRSTYR